MPQSTIYVVALRHCSKQRAEQIKKLLLLRKRCVCALDLETWMFAKKHDLPCMTLQEIIGDAGIGECITQGNALAETFRVDMDALYHAEELGIGSLMLGRMQKLLSGMSVFKKVSEHWRAQDQTPIFLDDNVDGLLSDYELYGPFMRGMAHFCGVSLSAPPLHRPPAKQCEDSPLVESTPSLQGEVLIAVEESEMPRYQDMVQTLRSEGQPAQGIMFPFDYDWYSTNRTGEQTHLSTLRVTPPTVTSCPDHFGVFPTAYPGRSQDPLLQEVWQCLQHIFYYYHTAYWPWLVRYYRLWQDFLRSAKPKALVTSIIFYPASILPSKAAESLGIPVFGAPHSHIPSLTFAVAPSSLITDKPFWHHHCVRLGLQSHLVQQEKTLININRFPATKKNTCQKRTILVLTAVNPMMLPHSPYAPALVQQALQTLGHIPEDLKDSIHVQIKWHPFDGDAGIWDIFGKDTDMELLNAQENLADYLQQAWMVVGLDYISSGLMEALEMGLPTCLFWSHAWEAYSHAEFVTTRQKTCGYFEALYKFRQPEELWKTARAWLNDDSLREQHLQSTAAFRQQLFARPGEGMSLKNIIDHTVCKQHA